MLDYVGRICPHCKTQIKENEEVRVCPTCGLVHHKICWEEHNGCSECAAQTDPQPQAPVPTTQKPKKKIYKRWYFWVIIVAAACLIVSVGNANKNKSGSADLTTQGTTAEKQVATAETEEEVTTASSEQTEEEYKSACETIDFETLARNPDKYKDNNYKFTGEIIQVQEGWGDEVDLRINITKVESEYMDAYWTDTIYATVDIADGEDKLLEDDVITFWGTCEGSYTYTSVLGSNITLPKISIKYYSLENVE